MANGILGTLLAALDNAKRTVGRNVKDLAQDPIGHAGKVASGVKEDLLKAASGDKEQLNALLGNLVGAGIIMGPTSKLWSPSMAKDAMDMQQIGYSAEDIWKATGVYTGPLDGKLRQEIADKGAKLRQELPKGYSEKRVVDILDHPELLTAYPELKNVRVQTNPAIKGGSYLGKNPYTKTEDITLGTAGTPDQALSSLLHELQHAVQGREGFTKGANIDSVKSLPEFKEGIKSVTGSSKPEVPSWTEVNAGTDNIMADLEREIAYSLYRRVGGEAEARAVQARQGMDPTDLWDLIPTESYDIGLQKLLRSPNE